MSYHLLVSLDTTTGTIRRWRRGALGLAEKIGEDFFPDWASIRQLEDQIYDLIQAFRVAWTPPEDPTPSGSSPRRVTRAA